ncbi:MAG: 3-phosphoshikimate 1-carboxyvinyltransferase [Verrucomicrobiota bacterium]|jgi:3-phosphoshikimate 1-carboxyvinyltransferase
MALPDLIEIVPLDKPVHAEITVPGSKSITNRALILAALADGEVTLQGALWSEDTQIMVECLQELGFMVNVATDPDEICNRTITVYGQGGKVPGGGTAENPLELFVGNAGTAARFLSALVCLGKGVYRLHGVPRMHERPQKALFKALRELGYRVDAPNDKLPAVIYGRDAVSASQKIGDGGTPSLPKKCTVSVEESSQFASALLLCAKVGGWKIEVTGENAEESPYVAMTSKLMEVFPHRGGKFQIEPDASSGSYFWAAGVSLGRNNDAIENKNESQEKSQLCERLATYFRWGVTVVGWPKSKWQIDAFFPWRLIDTAAHSIKFGTVDEAQVIQEYGSDWRNHPEKITTAQKPAISRQHHLGDSIMTLAVVAPFSLLPVKLIDLERLRVQECERVVALRTELTKCGAKVVEEGDTLTVYPSKLHGAEIETYNDHRMAMCFAILGLKVPGIKIKNPACVKKTFPNFFQKLAAPQPKGLGAEIWEIKNGQRTRKLSGEELFAG